MGFTNNGLINSGKTAHYSFQYDNALSQTDGLDRTNALLAGCEADFALMQSWFGGIGIDTPISVKVANASTGGAWTDTSVTLSPGSGTTADFLQYLLVMEVTEMFMDAQDKGWFQGSDEGSKGEGLSRFLAIQFQIANGLGIVASNGFQITPMWLNGTRPDFVTIAPDDNNYDVTNACTTLFVYYLHDQLGFSVQDIINAAADTLADVYKNLTGKSDAWAQFSNLVESHYPQGGSYGPKGDSVFPVSELSALFAPNQITCGYNEPAQIFIDRPAMAEVIVRLVSTDQASVIVPPFITIPVDSASVTLDVQTKATAGPFALKLVPVHATYAGKTLQMVVEVAPPKVVGVTLSPNTVICGHSVTGTVTLDRPSLNGDVIVDLISSAPGFATVPAQVTVLQNQQSAHFLITTPNIQIPFKTAHAQIFATYSGSSASALLTVKPKIVVGILHSLSVSPSTVKGGSSSHGTVTLEQAVPKDTVVTLAAVITGSKFPLPGNASSIVSVPASVTVHAGLLSAGFQITTKPIPAGTIKSNATIMAAATGTKYAMLTLTN